VSKGGFEPVRHPDFNLRFAEKGRKFFFNVEGGADAVNLRIAEHTAKEVVGKVGK